MNLAAFRHVCGGDSEDLFVLFTLTGLNDLLNVNYAAAIQLNLISSNYASSQRIEKPVSNLSCELSIESLSEQRALNLLLAGPGPSRV